MDAIYLIRLALSVIADRLLVIIAMSLSFVIAMWIMWYPDWIRLGTLTVFVIFAYLLLKIKEIKNEQPQRLPEQ